MPFTKQECLLTLAGKYNIITVILLDTWSTWSRSL